MWLIFCVRLVFSIVHLKSIQSINSLSFGQTPRGLASLVRRVHLYQVLVLLKLMIQTVQSVGFPNDRTKQGNVGEELINKYWSTCYPYRTYFSGSTTIL